MDASKKDAEKKQNTTSENSSSQDSLPFTKHFWKAGEALTRQKIWLVTAGLLTILFLLFLIFQSLRKEESDSNFGVSVSSLEKKMKESEDRTHSSQKESTSLKGREQGLTPSPSLSSLPEKEPSKFYRALDPASLTPPDKKIQELEERILVLEKIHERAAQVWQRTRLLLTALSGERPFHHELEEFENIASHQGKIKKLLEQIRPYAYSGAPSLERLKEYFDRLKLNFLRSEPSQGSWWERLKGNFGKLITLKRHQEGEKASLGEAFQQEEAELKEGKLDKALPLLSAFKESKSGSVGEWIRQAQARHTLDTVRSLLKEQVMLEMMVPQED